VVGGSGHGELLVVRDRANRRPVGTVRYHRLMAALTRDDVAHVAHLARLGLTDAELTLLEGQLNHILDQYAKLAELDTESIAPTAQTIELENILRDDVVTPSFTVDQAISNSAARQGDFIVVPAIIGGE
jgi:aspartyl-tRNA(Asn)/glutamyl-tRNA(Gln) amidotransferase subunit C